MPDKKPHYNTKHLLPATGYHNQLMREIDDAYWLGSEADALEAEADTVKEYVERGEAWYPLF